MSEKHPSFLRYRSAPRKGEHPFEGPCTLWPMNIPHKQSDSIELGNGGGAPLPVPLGDCVFLLPISSALSSSSLLFLLLPFFSFLSFPSLCLSSFFFFLLQPLASFPSFYSISRLSESWPAPRIRIENSAATVRFSILRVSGVVRSTQ